MSQFQILLTPVVAMMGFAYLLSAAMRRFHNSQQEQVAFGMLIGVTIAIGMANPLSLGDGLIFDARTLLTGAAVAFVGPIAGLIAMTFGIVFRIYLGGAGMMSGVVGLVLAFTLALAWVHLIRGRIKSSVLTDALLGAAVTPSIVAIFLLPFDLATTLFFSILPALLICNIVGAAAIGLIFRRERRYLSEVRKMQSHARIDLLTNLLNRRGMDREVGATKFDTTRGHVLFYFDVDNFKAINDSFGHDAGDAALAIVAARIKDIIRGEAVFARQGGDEFSIYVASLESRDVQGVADRLCSTISSQKFSHNGDVFPVTISLGGYWTKQDLTLQEMISRADEQLLFAKRAGKSRARVAFDQDRNASNVA